MSEMRDTTCQHCGKPVRTRDAKFCPACGKALHAAASDRAMIEGSPEEITVALDEVTPARCGLFVGLVAVRESSGNRTGRVAHLTLARPPAEPVTVTLFLGDHADYRHGVHTSFRVMLTGVYSDYVTLRVTPLNAAPHEAAE